MCSTKKRKFLATGDVYPIKIDRTGFCAFAPLLAFCRGSIQHLFRRFIENIHARTMKPTSDEDAYIVFSVELRDDRNHCTTNEILPIVVILKC